MARKKSLKDIKRGVAQLVRSSEADVENFVLSLKYFLAKNLPQALKQIERGDKNAAAKIGALLSEMKTRGLDAELSKVAKIYGAELARVEEAFSQVGNDFDLQRLDQVTLEALIRFKVEDIERRVEGEIEALKPLVMESVLTGIPLEFSRVTDRLDGRLTGALSTELNTALMSFHRTVNKVQADAAGLELFLYVGPDDDLTRPFCEDLLQKDPPIYTLEEIEAMDNEQGLSVMEYGGGYNCRHHWRPVSADFAKEFLGYGES